MTLENLADRFWSKAMEMQPTIATVRGVHDYDHLLPSLDDEWVADMSSSFRGVIAETEALEVDSMAIQERITQSLLLHQCRSRLGEVETPFRRASVDPFLGPHTRLLSDTRQNTVTDIEQANALLERYSRVPAYLSAALGTHIHCVDN
ncbi:MAG TPA: DUF885 family protein, partial [Acidimicrobiia bacterium]|nr:DUF885 family protein [Acidimicrobiia bacterium]